MLKRTWTKMTGRLPRRGRRGNVCLSPPTFNYRRDTLYLARRRVKPRKHANFHHCRMVGAWDLNRACKCDD